MALVVVVEVAVVVEAAVGSIELQKNRFTVSSVEFQRGHCQMQKEVTVS